MYLFFPVVDHEMNHFWPAYKILYGWKEVAEYQI